MNRRRYIGAALVVLAFGGALYGLSRLIGEPEFEGRALSEWLSELSYEHPEEVRLRAQVAVRAMGTNVLPTLFRMLTATDSALKQNLIRLEAKQSIVKIRFSRAEDEQVMAANGFAALRELAIPAIPRLTNCFGDPDATVRASYAIACTGPAGIPALSTLLSDPNAMIRSHATTHLGLAGRSAPHLVLPLLLGALNDPNEGVRRTCLSILPAFTNSSAAIVPSVIALLNDPSVRIRVSATIALGTMGNNASGAERSLSSLLTNGATFGPAASALLKINRANALGSLEEIMRDTNSPLRAAAASRLGMIGPDVREVIPMLINALRDPNGRLRLEATNALLQIDFSAATNAGVLPPSRRGRRGANVR